MLRQSCGLPAGGLCRRFTDNVTDTLQCHPWLGLITTRGPGDKAWEEFCDFVPSSGSSWDAFIAQANQKAAAYGAVIGEKQKDLETL